MKLISMTDFVISQWDKDLTREEYSQSMIHYATFLLKPLKLEMFIPINSSGERLEDPTPHGMMDRYSDKCNDWAEANEKVLFKSEDLFIRNCGKYSFSVETKNHNYIFNSLGRNTNNNVEDLIKYDLSLTDSAIKQLGL